MNKYISELFSAFGGNSKGNDAVAQGIRNELKKTEKTEIVAILLSKPELKYMSGFKEPVYVFQLDIEGQDCTTPAIIPNPIYRESVDSLEGGDAVTVEISGSFPMLGSNLQVLESIRSGSPNPSRKADPEDELARIPLYLPNEHNI